MDADLDTLCTALYLRVDDELKMRPELVRYRPAVGMAPKLSDAELVTLAVVQALLGFSSETRFLRFAKTHLKSKTAQFTYNLQPLGGCRSPGAALSLLFANPPAPHALRC